MTEETVVKEVVVSEDAKSANSLPDNEAKTETTETPETTEKPVIDTKLDMKIVRQVEV